MKMIYMFLLLILSACMPSDAYRMRYEQQQINYSLTTPIAKEKSEELTVPQDVTLSEAEKINDRPQHVRKDVKDTQVFYNQEDNEKFFTKNK